jgi:predicted nucleotidyltransferase component of viral defense system
MNFNNLDLFDLSKTVGFRAEILEKVVRLIELLNELFDNSFLRKRLVLKGGTALNLFYFDLPRLSVDIDLNYIGSIDRDTMLEERKELEEILLRLCQRSGFVVKRTATEHAGGKWRLNYASVIQASGNLEIDLSYLHRVTLWPVALKNSCKLGPIQAIDIPVLDLHELAAGKLAALMSRRASRDLYDAHRLLCDPWSRQQIDISRLRLAFVIYGGMNRHDWRMLNVENINFDNSELKNKLIPVLSKKEPQESAWVNRLVDECRAAILHILPFSEAEQKFLNLLLDNGEIYPSLITSDIELQQKISKHPGLLWKAQHVKKFNSIIHEN